jgi:hypothetical protein
MRALRCSSLFVWLQEGALVVKQLLPWVWVIDALFPQFPPMLHH